MTQQLWKVAAAGVGAGAREEAAVVVRVGWRSPGCRLRWGRVTWGPGRWQRWGREKGSGMGLGSPGFPPWAAGRTLPQVGDPKKNRFGEGKIRFEVWAAGEKTRGKWLDCGMWGPEKWA